MYLVEIKKIKMAKWRSLSPFLLFPVLVKFIKYIKYEHKSWQKACENLIFSVSSISFRIENFSSISFFPYKCVSTLISHTHVNSPTAIIQNKKTHFRLSTSSLNDLTDPKFNWVYKWKKNLLTRFQQFSEGCQYQFRFL